MARSGFEIRRVYEPQSDDGTYRVLVDRLWPRGVAKADAAVDEWAKEITPSSELRRWYGHDPAKFEEFARRYREELKGADASDDLARLRGLAKRRRVALVTATRDIEHSAAVVLLDELTGT